MLISLVLSLLTDIDIRILDSSYKLRWLDQSIAMRFASTDQPGWSKCLIIKFQLRRQHFMTHSLKPQKN